LASVAVILLHLLGFKVWGNEIPLIDIWRPLKNPRELVALEPPHTVVLAGGSKYRLHGVVITQAFTTAYLSLTNNEESMVAMIRIHRRVFRARGNEPIRVEPRATTNGTYRFGLEQRGEFGCGNSYDPRPFVLVSSRYREEDLGAWLVWHGIAYPEDGVASQDPAYTQQLKHYQELSRGIHP
jgi:hypothetical protein